MAARLPDPDQFRIDSQRLVKGLERLGLALDARRFAKRPTTRRGSPISSPAARRAALSTASCASTGQ